MVKPSSRNSFWCSKVLPLGSRWSHRDRLVAVTSWLRSSCWELASNSRRQSLMDLIGIKLLVKLFLRKVSLTFDLPAIIPRFCVSMINRSWFWSLNSAHIGSELRMWSTWSPKFKFCAIVFSAETIWAITVAGLFDNFPRDFSKPSRNCINMHSSDCRTNESCEIREIELIQFNQRGGWWCR